MNAPERVVLSSDFSPKFLNFAFIAGYFWKRCFGVKPDLALVVDNLGVPNLEHVLQILSPHCFIHVLVAHPNYPLINQVKIARWFLAANLDSTFTTLSDLDKLYLRDSYLVSKFSESKSSTLLVVGAEPNGETAEEVAIPIQGLSGDRQTFSSLFRAVGSVETFSKFVEYFDSPEFVGERTHLVHPSNRFSDEHLLRRYATITQTTSLFNLTTRDVDVNTRFLGHSSWPSEANIRRNAEFYEGINLPIPFLENRRKIMSTLEIIDPEFRFSQLPLPFSLREWRIRQVAWKFRQKIGIAT